jgi:hypothetical protein
MPNVFIETRPRVAKRFAAGNDEGQMIGVNHHGMQTLVFGIVADLAKLEIAVDQLRGDFAR